MSEKIKGLAANLTSRKRAGAEPYVLFLGAGASITTGCSSMTKIVEEFLQNHDSPQFEVEGKEIEAANLVNEQYGELLRKDISKKRLQRFFTLWGSIDGDSRYSLLRRHLWTTNEPSRGYIELAHLIKQGYFEIILTTNLDNLLEKALIKSGLIPPENFIVLTNRKDNPSEISEQLENRRIPVKLIKLHGTLESPLSYAFTNEEVFDFEKTIKPTIAKIINQSLVIVGHSMQDRDLDVLFEDQGKEIFFVNPVLPEPGTRIDNILRVRGYGNLVSGEDGAFDGFFAELNSEVARLIGKDFIPASAHSIDAFLEAIGYEKEIEIPRSRYRNLPTLYVRPTEYEEVKKTLEDKHLVFILGEPHMGKTYTALHLLWEYHLEGYKTLYIQHDQLAHLLHKHDDNVRDALLEIFTPDAHNARIVYFEDPFGETLERQSDSIPKNLDIFLELAQAYDHLRVIVTTRLNIFEESLRRNKVSEPVQEFVQTLRIHTSYHIDVLRDILHRYIKFYEPTWSSDPQVISRIDNKLSQIFSAPHNIEFFVRTSEALTSEEEVLKHAEESKHIVDALAAWIARMPLYEQLFIAWVEICSTASILFPDSRAAALTVQDAYNESLAFCFKGNHLPGIPVAPFSNALDKFSSIVFERREEKRSLPKLDFVHPSYHEAFWAAKNQKVTVSFSWELLKQNIGLIMRDLEHRIDLVQMKMIERYGTINRDLDQLLLLSAMSSDSEEQLVALQHMLQRTAQFSHSKEFSYCVSSLLETNDLLVKRQLLKLIDEDGKFLPDEVLLARFHLLFDDDASIRAAAFQRLGKDSDKELPPNHNLLKIWHLIRSVFLVDPIRLRKEFPDRDWITMVEQSQKEGEGGSERLGHLTAEELGLLLQSGCWDLNALLIRLINQSWAELTLKQKELIVSSLAHSMKLASRVQAEELILAHSEELLPMLGTELSSLGLTHIPQFLNIPAQKGRKQPVPVFSTISDEALDQLLMTPLPNFKQSVVNYIIRHYDKLSPSQRQNVVTRSSESDVSKAISTAIGGLGWTFSGMSNATLVLLLEVPGRAQYDVLLGLLFRFRKLSTKEKRLITELIKDPPGVWVGGSVAQVASKRFEEELRLSIPEEVSSMALALANQPAKKMQGAVLAEFAQYHMDEEIGLQTRYVDILFNLARDPEIVDFADQWIDFQIRNHFFRSTDYWRKTREHISLIAKSSTFSVNES